MARRGKAPQTVVAMALRFLLCAAILSARAQLSPTSTPGAVGCVARYIRVENTPGVTIQNFYVRASFLPLLQSPRHPALCVATPTSAIAHFPRASCRRSTRIMLEA